MFLKLYISVKFAVTKLWTNETFSMTRNAEHHNVLTTLESHLLDLVQKEERCSFSWVFFPSQNRWVVLLKTTLNPSLICSDFHRHGELFQLTPDHPPYCLMIFVPDSWCVCSFDHMLHHLFILEQIRALPFYKETWFYCVEQEMFGNGSRWIKSLLCEGNKLRI